jgi:probable addiction module antidote protein
MSTELRPFDAADYLDSEETLVEFLSAAAEDPNPDVLLSALAAAARASGMAQVAKQAGPRPRKPLQGALSGLPPALRNDRRNAAGAELADRDRKGGRGCMICKSLGFAALTGSDFGLRLTAAILGEAAGSNLSRMRSAAAAQAKLASP